MTFKTGLEPTEPVKSARLLEAEAKWYLAEQKLQLAAHKATAEFLGDGEPLRSGAKRGPAQRALQTAAEEFTEAHEAVRKVLAAEGAH